MNVYTRRMSMRKTKRLLCIVIVLALAVSLFAFPASADNSVS